MVSGDPTPSLGTHERNTEGERAHACEMCDRSFRYLSHLVRHQAIHSGKKPHACGECGRAFTRLSTLHHHHQQAPSGEKAFRYQRYGNTFNYSTLLVQHLWIHTQQGHQVREMLEEFHMEIKL